MKNAPKIIDYLNESSRNHFEKVKEYLEALNIDYTVNYSIVRGLDYYTHTVFEVEASVEGFGSQNVLCAGGRYNGLVETIGGPQTPGVGFALGLERLLVALEYEKLEPWEDKTTDFYIAPMDDTCKGYSLKVLNMLRMNGFNGDMDYMNRSLKSNFKQAERLNTKYIIIIGNDEIENNMVTIKDNETKESKTVAFDNIVDYFDEVM